MPNFIDISGWKMSEHGVKESRWTVIKYVGFDKHHNAMFLCRCECGVERIVNGSTIRKGKSLSCGCLQIERTSNANKRYNKFDISGEYGIVFCDDKKVLFDIEDYDKIKNHYWYISNNGYAIARINKNKQILMHRIILGTPPDGMVIDHYNRNKLDNRKSNIKFVSRAENNRNSSRNNQDGFVGVSKNHNNYVAYITVEYKNIYLGTFKTQELALIARLKAEKEYFGDFAPQRNMFEKYNI